MPNITIGFIPREQFSRAADSLRKLFACTQIPFNLIVVNCNTPKIYWQQIEEVIRDRDNVKVIHTDHYLLPCQANNLVIEEAKDEFLCFLQNDVLVTDGWLSKLIAACEKHPADVAVPLIMETAHKIHWDSDKGQYHLHSVSTPAGMKWELRRKSDFDFYKDEQERHYQRQTVLFIEDHCLLFRRKVFDKITFDGEISIYAASIDLSLGLIHNKIPVVFEPSSVVYFKPPYPPKIEEIDYFLMKWDVERAVRSCDRIKKKHNLLKVPGDNLNFVKDRQLFGQLCMVNEELKALLLPTDTCILVDEGVLIDSDLLKDFHTIPFPEHEGQYWGPPSDDEAAIQELERLRQTGANAIVFFIHTFWWLEHYAKFNEYLHQKFTCALQKDYFTVFKLN